MYQTQQIDILNRMNQKPKGTVFCTKDFLDTANSGTVRKALKRLVDAKQITRLMDGLYAILEYSDILKKEIYPSPNTLAHAIARRFEWNIYPSGNVALNITDISNQITNTYEYLSDGPYRVYKYLGHEIKFKRTANNKLKGYSPEMVNLITSISTLGKDKINIHQKKLLQEYSKKRIEISEFERNTNFLPERIYEELEKIKENIINDKNS